jgi:hypothetical protein
MLTFLVIDVVSDKSTIWSKVFPVSIEMKVQAFKWNTNLQFEANFSSEARLEGTCKLSVVHESKDTTKHYSEAHGHLAK